MTERATTDAWRRIYARTPEPRPGSSRTRAEIAGVAAIIAEEFHPHRIVLFGSHARGQRTPYSEVDLMVVMERPGPQR